MKKKQAKQRAGHQEIQGETIAKFEFFDAGWNPYSRYLDVDKIDLILRKRTGKRVEYKEIQVKYGRLYSTGPKWQKRLFDVTSWRFFKLDEFKSARSDFFIAYVLSHPDHGYKGDIFVFPANEFHQIVKSCHRVQTQKGPRAAMYIARAAGSERWYVWRKKRFDKIHSVTTREVTRYRRNLTLTG